MMNRKTVEGHEVTGEVRALHSAALGGAGAPQRVLLSPWGEVESTNGRFVVDEESARLVERAFDEHGTDLPIDYEHQTLGGAYASPSGQAPAAGWIKRMYAEPGVGLMAEIEWTEQARERLEAREYRYLSPVAMVRKSDRKLTAIHSAALTNKPAIVGMRPIVNREELADEEAATAPLGALRAELCLPEDADAEEVLLTAGERLSALQRQQREDRVERRIGEAVRAGKLVEAQRTWAEALVAKEEELFDEWLRTAPVVVQPGRISPPGVDDLRSSARSVENRARAEYRANRMLAGLTSEEAYVAAAVRDATPN